LIIPGFGKERECLAVFIKKNQIRRIGSTILNSQKLEADLDSAISKITMDSRDLFLRKNNVVYFVDINGKPLDSGSQKLFEMKCPV